MLTLCLLWLSLGCWPPRHHFCRSLDQPQRRQTNIEKRMAQDARARAFKTRWIVLMLNQDNRAVYDGKVCTVGADEQMPQAAASKTSGTDKHQLSPQEACFSHFYSSRSAKLSRRACLHDAPCRCLRTASVCRWNSRVCSFHSSVQVE